MLNTLSDEQLSARSSRVNRALVTLFVIFALMIVISLIVGRFVPANTSSEPCYAGAVTVTDYNITCAIKNAGETVVRFLSIIVLAIFGQWLTSEMMGYMTAYDMNEDLHTPDNNDSPVMVIVGAAVMAAFVVSKVPFAGFAPFLVNLLFRYGVGMIYFLIFEAVLLRQVSVKNLKEALRLVNLSSTNSVAWVTLGALIIAGLLVTATVA